MVLQSLWSQGNEFYSMQKYADSEGLGKKTIIYINPAAIFWTPFHVAPLQDPQLCCEGQWLAKTLRTKGQKIVSYEINATHDHYQCVKELKSLKPLSLSLTNRYKQAHMIKPM